MAVERFDGEPSTRNRHRIVPVATRRRVRIAVADDEKNLLAIVASILSGAGYEVCTASDGCALLELVASFDPDVVLTDVSMPRMTGLEVLRELRERRSAPRVVLMTAWPSWDSEDDIVGASAVLHKPFDTDTLLEAVRRA